MKSFKSLLGIFVVFPLFMACPIFSADFYALQDIFNCDENGEETTDDISQNIKRAQAGEYVKDEHIKKYICELLDICAAGYPDEQDLRMQFFTHYQNNRNQLQRSAKAVLIKKGLCKEKDDGALECNGDAGQVVGPLTWIPFRVTSGDIRLQLGGHCKIELLRHILQMRPILKSDGNERVMVERRSDGQMLEEALNSLLQTPGKNIKRAKS